MTTKDKEIILADLQDSNETPAMLQVLSDNTYQQAFVFALAVEPNPKKRAYDSDKLLLAIVAGADSALQSIKGSIDVGSQGLRFGLAEKTEKQFVLKDKLLSLGGEKGKYSRLNMPIVNLPNAMGIVHEEVSTSSKYVLSMDDNPADAIADFMGTAYNLQILDEWKNVLFNKLVELDYIKQVDMYVDPIACPNLRLYSVSMDEDQADAFISDMLKSKVIQFPYEGDGNRLNEINELGQYMLEFSEPMAEKITQQVQPLHNPATDEYLPVFDTFDRKLFPVQAHASTAIAKLLSKKDESSVILQGEMSTGKSTMMVASAHGYATLKGLKGYFSALICPPSLTVKWPKEIKMVIPNAEVHVIKRTEEFIKYHTEWQRAGRPKPTKPTFFIFSFTTLRNDSANQPIVEYLYTRSRQQSKDGVKPYRAGYHCPDCGKPHQVILSTKTELHGDKEVEVHETRNMEEKEFGTSRRLGKSTSNPPNGFCYHCGASLWSKKVKKRYDNYADYAKRYLNPLTSAIVKNDQAEIMALRSKQPDYPSSTSMPRRVAAAEYIRRKCKGFFEVSIADEVHELKGGATAQGQALHSVVKASKKMIAGTGTLFGGKSSDVYYLIFRLFEKEMVKNGFDFREITPFIEQFGNLEEINFVPDGEAQEYTNKASRGGAKTHRKKEIPGYTPRIYPTFFLKNVVNVRLKDVWPNPVELIDTPTIFCEMTDEQKSAYEYMIREFEREIDSREDGFKLYTQMIDYGISYVDNPSKFPNAYYNNKEKELRELIWEAEHLNDDVTYPKEQKLQEIVTNEVNEGRPCIVYVTDTGSSVKERDIRPRLKKKLEDIGAKVCILDSTTTATNRRSEWLEKKIVEEGYDVCIVSQELVKVGLDLLCTPTLIYYQFSWSLYTLQQSSRRAWRIGQTEECRLFYLAYADTYQQYMATLIAKKSKASAAVNGDVSSDGLSAMLGDEEDLQSMLLKSIKEGKKLDGLAEDWIADASERSKELLANIGQPKLIERRLKNIQAAEEVDVTLESEEEKAIELDEDYGDSREDLDNEAAMDIAEAFAVSDQVSKVTTDVTVEIKTNIITLGEVKAKVNAKKSKAKKKVSDDQLTFDLFAL